MSIIPQVIPFVIGLTEAPVLTGDLNISVSAPALADPFTTTGPALVWGAGEPSLNWSVGEPTLNT